MRPSSISLSKDALAYSRIVSLSWLEAVGGVRGRGGEGGRTISPHGMLARRRTCARPTSCTCACTCYACACSASATSAKWACGGRCDGRRGDVGRARLVLEAVEHVHEAALDPQLELVRMRDLEPLDLLQVALRDGDHLAALLRLPSEAARVHAQDAEVLLAVLVLAAEDDVAKLGGTGISGSGRHARRKVSGSVCWRNGIIAGPGVRATPPPNWVSHLLRFALHGNRAAKASRQRAAALVASESAPRVEGAERREFSGLVLE